MQGKVAQTPHLLFYGVCHQQSRDHDLPLLTDAVHSRHRLLLDSRVQRGLQQKDARGSSQRQAS
jgi:hypothetical protein